MNTQEKFTKVANHLLKQNKKAMDGSSCRYKSSDGLRCAFGCLLPDGHPAEEAMASISQLCNKFLDIKELVGLDIDLLCDLQLLHDYEPIKEWPRLLSEMAVLNGLEFAPPITAN